MLDRCSQSINMSHVCFSKRYNFQLSSWFLRHITVWRSVCFNAWRRYISTRPGLWFTPVHPVKGFVVVCQGEEAAIFTSLAWAWQQLQVHAGKPNPHRLWSWLTLKTFCLSGSVGGWGVRSQSDSANVAAVPEGLVRCVQPGPSVAPIRPVARTDAKVKLFLLLTEAMTVSLTPLNTFCPSQQGQQGA